MIVGAYWFGAGAITFAVLSTYYAKTCGSQTLRGASGCRARDPVSRFRLGRGIWSGRIRAMERSFVHRSRRLREAVAATHAVHRFWLPVPPSCCDVRQASEWRTSKARQRPLAVVVLLLFCSSHRLGGGRSSEELTRRKAKLVDASMLHSTMGLLDARPSYRR
jgi:hypothetical protein